MDQINDKKNVLIDLESIANNKLKVNKNNIFFSYDYIGWFKKIFISIRRKIKYISIYILEFISFKSNYELICSISSFNL